MKVHREHGNAGFFRPPRRRSASVLTAEVNERAQALLDEGESVPEVSRAIGVGSNTPRKAIHAGRLHAVKRKR
jgi:transposase-like protein